MSDHDRILDLERRVTALEAYTRIGAAATSEPPAPEPEYDPVREDAREYVAAYGADQARQYAAELLSSLGPARRAVVVTLPDEWEQWFDLSEGRITLRLERATPDTLREAAAAMIAFALYREETQ